MKPHKQRELTTLTFTGPQFDDHGLEIDVLHELIAYKALLIATAKELWRTAHPDRIKLPGGFAKSVQVKFYELGRGCTTVPLYRVQELEEGELPLAVEDEFDQAADLIEDGIQAADSDKPFPTAFPKDCLGEFRRFGSTLAEDQAITAKSPRRQTPAKYSKRVQERILGMIEARYQDTIDVTGEVRLADLDGSKFAIRTEDGAKIEGTFDPDQEETVTEALKKHHEVRVRVLGEGEFDPETGSVKRFAHVETIEVEAAEQTGLQPGERPIWEVIAEIGARVPGEAWDEIPSDLSRNLDHYLYGVPKDDE